jgi:NAD(P)-dependent dehydrogenase (short-subunit alcohol dehydrogenase family)
MDPRRVFANVVDAALEATVVLSFTDVGPIVRRRLDAWPPLSSSPMDGRVVAVTGAGSGLGLVTATQLAAVGASLRLLVRDPAKGGRAAATIREQAPDAEISIVRADLSDLGSVRTAAETLAAEDRLDVLIHNAGTLHTKRRTSADGHEMTFATMVLGPHLLTRELLPLLTRTAAEHAGARVITVSSGGMYLQRLHLDDLDMEREPYRGTIAYARAKRAQVVLNERWARRTVGARIAFHAMHPGWAATPGIEASLPGFSRLIGRRLRTPLEGADTIAWLAAAPEVGEVTGRFWLDRRPRGTVRAPGTATSEADAEALWDAVEAMTGSPG